MNTKTEPSAEAFINAAMHADLPVGVQPFWTKIEGARWHLPQYGYNRARATLLMFDGRKQGIVAYRHDDNHNVMSAYFDDPITGWMRWNDNKWEPCKFPRMNYYSVKTLFR